jgi:hypothetical protein
VRYFLRTVIGLALLLGGAVVIAYDVYQLLQIGTCATGGPYVSARQCPPGTERLGLTIPIALIVMAIGTGLYATRRKAPGGEGGGRRVNAWILAWCAIFLGIAFASFWGVWGPDANPGPGGKEGGLIVGFLFVLMGGAALPFLVSRDRTPAERQVAIEGVIGRLTPKPLRSRIVTRAPSGDPPPDGGDAVSKLERLNRLRDEGAITAEEYERLKRDVIAGSG